jgi:hexokinase
MYVCEADDDNLEGTRVVLEEMCRTGETKLVDREIVKKVCELVGQRAAVLLGASIAGVVEHMINYGIGLDYDGDGFAICKYFFFLLLKLKKCFIFYLKY